MKTKILWIAAIGLFGANVGWGDVRLPKLVGDNMVLQRGAKIVIWGWADPGERVQIDFQGQQRLAIAAPNGKWDVSVGPFPAGGPYEMTVHGKNTLTLRNILIGDVWLASGQSNMEFPLMSDGGFGGVVHAEREMVSANYPRIRLFRVHNKIALKPRQDVEADTWTAVSPQTVSGFSAVAYLFGRELFQQYQVPIGLIESNWGGTVAEAWVSAGSLKPFPEFKKDIDSLKQINERTAIAEYSQYLKQKAAWDALHATEDRGRADGREIWAAVDFNDSAWPTIVEPQTRVDETLKGYKGAIWFRKAFDVPAGREGTYLQVHLDGVGKNDTTYFNGEKIGETQGWDEPRDYVVPGKLVKAGRNVIAVRLTAGGGHAGFFGEADKMNVEIGSSTVSLAGKWSYQPVADLSALPMPSVFAKFNSDPNTATLLFNGMISPLTSYRIKGVIWYQGESNADRSAQYRTLFPALIEDWRNQWGYPMPFLFVQLAGFGHNKPEPAEYPWADLREAQSMALSLPNTGMATAVDIGDEKDIHPRDKQDVAHRLALAAASVAYGENIVCSGPTYQSMAIEGSRIRIKFSNIGSGLMLKGRYGYVLGFEIAASEGKYVWAQALQDGQDIVVFNEAIQRPVAVRYDWTNTPDGNLYNREGLPAIPFRTD